MKWKDINWVGMVIYVLYPIAMAILIAVLLYKLLSRPSEPEGVDAVTVRVDTVHDTIFIDNPVAVSDTVVRWLRIYLKQDSAGLLSPIEDNTSDSTGLAAGNPDGKLELTDSACLMLPISQKTYTDDSTYTAWVSGYKPQLDSISIYRQIVTRNFSVTKQKRWSWGVQGGLYLTPRGLQPGFGYGFTYRIPP